MNEYGEIQLSVRFPGERQIGTRRACYIRTRLISSQSVFLGHCTCLIWTLIDASMPAFCPVRVPTLSHLWHALHRKAISDVLENSLPASDVWRSNSIRASFQRVRLAEDETRWRFGSGLPLMPWTGKTPAPGGTASL